MNQGSSRKNSENKPSRKFCKVNNSPAFIKFCENLPSVDCLKSSPLINNKSFMEGFSHVCPDLKIKQKELLIHH